MANQVAARLSGDDYQHLYAWQFVLELKIISKNVRQVGLEDALGGSVDDVTVKHETGTALPDAFYQVKYHVDQREQYSTDSFIFHNPGESSLLQKFWDTWRTLKAQDPARAVELHLVSNWTWDGQDKLKSFFDGEDNKLKPELFDLSTRTQAGKLREKWRTHLGISSDEFKSFASCLRFKLGYDCWNEMKQRVAERMEYLKLKNDDTSLLVAVGIVREWIKARNQTITLDVLEETLKKHDLYTSSEAERCVTVYLSTIKEQRFDVEPDHLLDWRDYFVGSPNKKGHQLKDEFDWNGHLLPELEALEAKINRETDCRLIRARGLARLSAWFAFGHAFSEVARYTIEVDQQGRLWRTDTPPNPDFKLVITSAGGAEGETLDDKGDTVAVGISITGLLDNDVRAHLESRTNEVSALLLIRPERELGRECFSGAEDVTALADGVKELVRNFVKHRKATRLLVYYFGPLSGACFLGHRLNAVCRETQIMEDQQPGYSPSFSLK